MDERSSRGAPARGPAPAGGAPSSSGRHTPVADGLAARLLFMLGGACTLDEAAATVDAALLEAFPDHRPAVELRATSSQLVLASGTSLPPPFAAAAYPAQIHAQAPLAGPACVARASAVHHPPPGAAGLAEGFGLDGGRSAPALVDGAAVGALTLYRHHRPDPGAPDPLEDLEPLAGCWAAVVARFRRNAAGVVARGPWRERLADELHDGPVQVTVSIGLRLQRLAGRLTDSADRQVAGDLRAACVDATDELNRLVRRLRAGGPPVGSEPTVAAVVRRVLGEVVAGDGRLAGFDFDADDDRPAGPLTGQVVAALVDEAASALLDRLAATTLQVTVAATGASWTVQLAAATARPATAEDRRAAVRTVAAAALACGGACEVASDAGGRTVFTLRCPVLG